jgi:hypothetical protein
MFFPAKTPQAAKPIATKLPHSHTTTKTPPKPLKKSKKPT